MFDYMDYDKNNEVLSTYKCFIEFTGKAPGASLRNVSISVIPDWPLRRDRMDGREFFPY